MPEKSDYVHNHYVPEWYQYRFFDGSEKEKKFYYLDMSPEVVRTETGKQYTRDALLKWGPPSCFKQEDLYTTQFKEWKSTEIEQYFFGAIDIKGMNSVEYFTQFEHPSMDNDAYRGLLTYMSVQKLRTPKGLKYLSSIMRIRDKNELLFKMQEYHNMHCALWTECVWCIVDASQSDTKFICSDHPVTVYNEGCFPASTWCRGADDPAIWLNGTHTIFPLSYNKALILTNLSWARDPYSNPLKERPHSQLFRSAMFSFMDIQTGRSLTDEEVTVINYIIKKRAYRYIAAINRDWLYPEEVLKNPRWDKIAKPYLLMPDPRAMTFSSEIIIGYKDGSSDAFDEYGRKPWHDDFTDKQRHDYEWNTFHAFQSEYARIFGPKRRGIAFSGGSIDKDEDSEEYHKYLLKGEHKYKRLIKQSSKRRRNKKH